MAPQNNATTLLANTLRRRGRGQPFEKGNRAGFQPGRSGNPNGRPKGSPTLIYTVRGVFAAALQDEAVRKGIVKQIKVLLKDPKTLLAVLDLAAKLNGELRQDQVAPVTTVNVYTNVRPERMRGEKGETEA